MVTLGDFRDSASSRPPNLERSLATVTETGRKAEANPKLVNLLNLGSHNNGEAPCSPAIALSGHTTKMLQYPCRLSHCLLMLPWWKQQFPSGY